VNLNYRKAPMAERKLPRDPNKSFTVNGIKYANRSEYDERVKEDAQKMAAFLYDLYKKQKLLSRNELND
jgi:hypothetical protein